MRLRIIILAVFFVSSLIAFARKQETVAELIARAESSKLDDRPHLYTEIGRRQVKAADELYDAGKPEEGRAAAVPRSGSAPARRLGRGGRGRASLRS